MATNNHHNFKESAVSTANLEAHASVPQRRKNPVAVLGFISFIAITFFAPALALAAPGPTENTSNIQSTVLSTTANQPCVLNQPIHLQITPIPNMRAFKVVDGDTDKIIMSLRCSNVAAGSLTVREVSRDGSLGPELTAWIQHYGPGDTLNKNNAAKADLLITCHPEMYDTPKLLTKHVFPQAHGEIGMVRRVRFNQATRNVDNFLLVFPISS